MARARFGGTALIVWLLLDPAAYAQSPREQPRLQPGNLVYLGSFTLPSSDGSGRSGEQGSLRYGGRALGIGADGQSLYYGCHAWHNMLAQVTIPAIGGAASVVTPCTTIPNLAAIDPDTNESKVLGGSMVWNGRTIVSAYTFYDGRGNATASHFAGPSLATLAGPARFGGAGPGLVGGYMGVVPPEWRALLGGPALTGLCCTSVISRSSYGPAAGVFDPDAIGVQGPVPLTLLVGYPSAQVALGDWGGSNPLFNGSTEIGGVAFPEGSRSVLFIGRHGDNFCYGEGVDCDDPTDASKGNHAYPYRHQIWAYDANDLLAVKQGAKKPWDLRPYGVWTLPGMADDGSAKMASAAYDPATRRFYVAATSGSATPRVHVYSVTTTPLPPVSTPPWVGPRLAGRVEGTTAHFALVPPLTGPASAYALEAGLAPGRADYVLPLGAAKALSVPGVPAGRYYVRARETSSLRRVSNEVAITVGCTRRPSAVSAPEAATSGSVVSLTWSDPEGCSGTTYRVSLDAAGGNAAGMTLASPTTSALMVLPTGSYSARVTAVSGLGSGEASAEQRFAVAGGGCSAPAFKPALTSRVTQGVVRLRWSPVDTWRATADDRMAPVSYVLEVGSAPGAANIFAAMPMQRASSLVTPAPPGQYFVRVRAMNACGAGPASNEVRVAVP